MEAAAPVLRNIILDFFWAGWLAGCCKTSSPASEGLVRRVVLHLDRLDLPGIFM